MANNTEDGGEGETNGIRDVTFIVIGYIMPIISCSCPPLPSSSTYVKGAAQTLRIGSSRRGRRRKGARLATSSLSYHCHICLATSSRLPVTWEPWSGWNIVSSPFILILCIIFISNGGWYTTFSSNIGKTTQYKAIEIDFGESYAIIFFFLCFTTGLKYIDTRNLTHSVVRNSIIWHIFNHLSQNILYPHDPHESSYWIICK